MGAILAIYDWITGRAPEDDSAGAGGQDGPPDTVTATAQPPALMAATHNHRRTSRNDINLDPTLQNGGCILLREKDALKTHIADYIDSLVQQTTDGDGCLENDFVQGLWDHLKSSFSSAADRSSQLATENEEAAAAEPIAINHSDLKRLIRKIEEAINEAMGTSDKCISRDSVGQLKERINLLIDNPPKLPIGLALKKYRKFVEAKYRFNEETRLENKRNQQAQVQQQKEQQQ